MESFKESLKLKIFVKLYFTCINEEAAMIAIRNISQIHSGIKKAWPTAPVLSALRKAWDIESQALYQ